MSPLRLSARPLHRREIAGGSGAENTWRIGRKWSPKYGVSSATSAPGIGQGVVRLQSHDVRLDILSIHIYT